MKILHHALRILSFLCVTFAIQAQDPSAILELESETEGMLMPRMTEIQRNSIINPANGLIIYQITPPNGFYFYDGTEWRPVASSGKHYPGEFFGGGIVIHTDVTGLHGLILTTYDVDTAHIWSNITNTSVGDSAQSTWDGFQNSMATVNQQQHTHSAAQLCLNYTNPPTGTGVHSDWYLPSTEELRLLINNSYEVYKALDTDGNPTTTIPNGFYWSSMEGSDSTALGCGIWSELNPFGINSPETGVLSIAVHDSLEISGAGEISFSGTIIVYSKSDSLHVRAVRAF